MFYYTHIWNGDGSLSSLIMKVRGSTFSVPVKTQYGGIWTVHIGWCWCCIWQDYPVEV